MGCISHVTDKVIFGDEASFGTETVAYTKDMGVIQSFNINEVENFEQIGQVGDSFVSSSNELGLYSVTGSIETLATKASLPELLELMMGKKDLTTIPGDYITTNSIDLPSLSAKAEYTPTTILQVFGIVFTNVTYDISKDGNFVVSADYFAKVMTEETETISANINSEKIFKGLDISATYGGTALIINSLSLTADWNMNAEDGRGVEAVGPTQRRQIQRACKHNLTVSGNLDAEVEAGFEVGYTDEKTDSDLVITISRDTDNVHVFTVTGCQLDNKDIVNNIDNSLRTLTADIIALNYSVTGDL